MARRVAACVVALVVLLAAGTAAGDPGTEKERVDGHIAELQGEAAAKAEQAGVLTEELSAAAGRVRELEAGVSAQETLLAVLEGDLGVARARLGSLDRELAARTKELRRIEREHAVAVERLERHVRAIYVSDDPDFVAVVFGATSFNELLDSLELLGRIGKQDQDIARRVAASRDRIAAARARTSAARAEAASLERVVAARAAEQRAVVARLAASRDALVAAQDDRQTTLSSIRESRADVLAEIGSLQAESARLADLIRAAQSSSSTPITAPVTGTGVLRWPVSGPVTSGFGMRWGRMHEGIDIAVPSGTPVGASASGTVVYTGWLGGYGNLVVVDHGGGLSTAYAHNTSVTVAVGQSVETGQVIAFSGNTGNSSGPHVHFEVRVNGTAVDPLGYL